MLAARRAGLHELGAVQAITQRAYRRYVDELGFMPMPMTEDYTPRLAAGEVWMVSRGEADVALAVLQPAPDCLVIYSLAVLPGEQGSGVGRWMLDFAAARARRLGLPGVRLFTNTLMARNIQIYRKAGFHEVGRRPNPHLPGFMLVDMARAL